MKTFWPTFWAILAAATVISLVAELKSCADDNARINAETAAIKAETAALNAQLEQDKRDRAARDAATEAADKKAEKEAAEFRKAHGLPEPIYPTLDETPPPKPLGR